MGSGRKSQTQSCLSLEEPTAPVQRESHDRMFALAGTPRLTAPLLRPGWGGGGVRVNEGRG